VTGRSKSELALRCPQCGKSFASTIQMDPDRWELIGLDDGMVERCTRCGRSSRFPKSSYFFRPSRVGLASTYGAAAIHTSIPGTRSSPTH
jgi:uncharacterized C2H2 Zn-finger protein